MGAGNENLPPLKYDSKGFPLYMPRVLKKRKRLEKRRKTLARDDAIERGDRGELPDTMTGAEWLRARERRYMLLDELREHVNAPVGGTGSVQDTLHLLGKVRRFWSKFADELPEESCGDIIRALMRVITDDKATASDINSSVAQVRGLLREAEEHFKGKTGAVPAGGTVNLTQINLVAELQKNPELVKLLVHEAGKMGLLESKDGRS